MAIGKKVTDRVVSNVKRYQQILATAKTRDISESDTVMIIADMLTDVFGYKKHEEITTEFAIRGTYCDLAIKVDNDVRFLIEAKAVGIDLKEAHIKQAIDYGANQGVEWIVLTNGVRWQFYKIHFNKPIDKSLVFDLNILEIKANDEDLVECFGTLCRECYSKGSLSEFYAQQQALSKYMVATVVLSEPIIAVLRRELKKLAPKLKVDAEQIQALLEHEVIKRELLDSEESKKASDDYKKAMRKHANAKAKEDKAAA